MISQRLQRRLSTLTAAGVCLIVVTFLLLPVFITVPLAFSDQRYLGIADSRFTAKWFENINRDTWRQAIGTSLLLGIASAGAAVALASPLAYWSVLHAACWRARLLRALLLGVLIVPPIWIATGYFRLFREGNLPALFLGHTLLGLPLAFSCLWYGMARLDQSLHEAARMLGADHWSTMCQVYLPASARYVFAAFFVAFLTSWDETVFALLTADPQTVTVPKLAFESMRLDRDFTVAAINILAGIVLAPVLVMVLHRVER